MGGASRGVKQQPRFPGPPTTCSSAEGHQRSWWPRTTWPCPAQGSHPFWLLPAPNLCQVPQGLLQPLSILRLQGRLLLEPQGFLEWYWGDRQRGVRVSALVRNPTFVSLTGLPPISWPRRPCPGASSSVDPTAAPVSSLNRPGPERCGVLPQVTQPIGGELDVEPRPDPTQKDDQPRQYP